MSLDTLIKDLQNATADLHRVNPWMGFVRFVSIGCVFIGAIALAWSSHQPLVIGSATFVAGCFYAFWLICTHDMTHHTLTGWRWFDTIMPRLVSWPIGWPHGLYSQIHRLHHGWNGSDLRDPERVQWTQDEYQAAHPILKWYVRHQWVIDAFVLGGIGLILRTVFHAIQLRKSLPHVQFQMGLDIGGIIAIQSLFWGLAMLHGALLRYVLFWLVLERIIGVIIQTRGYLEHYGLWGKSSRYQLTQLYACRNLHTSTSVNWIMGGLPYHSVHHAFPDIPFNHLPLAFKRVQAVLQQHELPQLHQGDGYIDEALRLSNHASLIGTTAADQVTGQRHMLPI